MNHPLCCYVSALKYHKNLLMSVIITDLILGLFTVLLLTASVQINFFDGHQSNFSQQIQVVFFLFVPIQEVKIKTIIDRSVNARILDTKCLETKQLTHS